MVIESSQPKIKTIRKTINESFNEILFQIMFESKFNFKLHSNLFKYKSKISFKIKLKFEFKFQFKIKLKLIFSWMFSATRGQAWLFFMQTTFGCKTALPLQTWARLTGIFNRGSQISFLKGDGLLLLHIQKDCWWRDDAKGAFSDFSKDQFVLVWKFAPRLSQKGSSFCSKRYSICARWLWRKKLFDTSFHLAVRITQKLKCGPKNVKDADFSNIRFILKTNFSKTILSPQCQKNQSWDFICDIMFRG